MAIPVIDLFAGPGGLGEGFSSLLDDNNERIFDIKLSIEKDVNAHETLRLRSFFRKFKPDEVPEAYYNIVRAKSWRKRKELIEKLKDDFPVEWDEADQEAWCVELPYPEEYSSEGERKGGYNKKEIEERNNLIDDRISQALSNEKNFLLIGGPPCQAYSLVGRSRNKGIFNEDHRVHLYKEYLRIIAKHQPAAFIMENVKGLLSSSVDGVKIFDLIHKDLNNPTSVFPEYSCPKYRIFSLTKNPKSIKNGEPEYRSGKDYLIKSEDYGIPQKRHRVILFGIREDFQHPGQFLEKKGKVPLKDVIGDIPPVRSGISRRFTGYDNENKYANGNPKRVYQKLNDSDDLWSSVINKQINNLKKWGDLPLNGLKSGPTEYTNGIGSEFIKCNKTIDPKHPLKSWFIDDKLQGLANHESRSHLTQDLMRYMFAGLYVDKFGTFPRLKDYAKHNSDLIPDHANVDSGKFTDRFRVQIANEPATTVTSHISKDGHYFIHYDPSQCRSLTVREAARIQTFPDNYLFCGSRTAQFHQVGNAVPPYLAYQIAKIVLDFYKKNVS
ncbi:DNA (cytosine-5-)-methyltransferase [Mangrovivirga sp. M17]|uniref:DNA (cytosine-5-)-methyltransferase n=1 Tax=Mangrovivirga halotolerans TaxID=2993936 RepID=A0ABT3RPC8_9BACT|nr:DNA (cytosine-5-)-methyltransferase [Mangrovivirga halotolerans]MCX2743660.1 DNA (cytosine-5-)-methyltransferase [Mangrovivirga halotolerans]